MTDPILVKDLFAIPEHVRTSDFVSVLTRDVDAPERTADTYVSTPALVEAFDRALDLVGHALDKRETRGAVLHGSFGSGKSHFMAMLSLMLQGHEAPWRLPELHPLRDKYTWLGELTAAPGEPGRRLLELHVHMLGKETLESAVFENYVSLVRKRHPDAPLPALYADQALFENAAGLRATLGDEAFFGKMNEAVGAKKTGLAKRRRWSGERFEAALESSEPSDRARLFDALVKSHFPAFLSGAGGRYLGVGPGLDALTDHAKALGYDGLVFFLDELILWLATEKVAQINQETPKIGVLAEHDGAIPIVSFIAQQRGLDEMVGGAVRGDEQVRLKQLLHFWEDRFDHLQFENKNLPAIIEKRLLVPKDAAAKETLSEAFRTMQKRTGRAFGTLIGDDDTEAFQKLYPFSPALVETLVALSTALSRHRTAIKLLAELLVDHIEDLRLGQLVLLGDVFDVLHDDMADGILRHLLRDAKKLYGNLLPVIQTQHGTRSPERCQRLRSDSERRRSLGCSGCPEKACRSDNRLLKSLLLAALVPQAKSLDQLTVTKLAELNQGGLHVALKGTEATKVLGTLRGWATSFPDIRVGEGTNPRVAIELGGVDIEPILQAAGRVDNPGQQKDMLKRLLLEAIGIDDSEQTALFRETRRPGKVRFGNVRTLGAEQFKCEPGHEWMLIIDYPFDDESYGPAEDEAKLEAMREAGVAEWTLAWLPSFLSKETEKHLRDLVRLAEVLRSSDSRRQYLGHLGHEKRAEAERVLVQHEATKKRAVLSALATAYGVRTGNEADLDPTRRVERHHWLLQPTRFDARPASSLADAYTQHVRALLTARYPSHPELGTSLTVAKVDEMAALFDEAAAAPNKQVRVTDKKQLEKARALLEPLGVGLVRDDTLHVSTDRRLRPVDQIRQQKNVAEPSVEELLSWADPEDSRGLRTPAGELMATLFVRAFASWQGRTFVRGDEHYDASGKKALAPDARLRQPEMPAPRDWEKARKVGSDTLGVSATQHVGHRADNIAWFASEVKDKVSAHGPAAAALPAALSRRLERLGVEGANRLVTARSADALCAALSKPTPLEVVDRLAAFEAETSGTAVLRSLASSAEVRDALEDDLLFGYFDGLDAGTAAAQEIFEGLKKALCQDEFQIGLADRLRKLANEARKLAAAAGAPAKGPTLTSIQAPEPAPPGVTTVFVERTRAEGRADVTAALATLGAKVVEVLEAGGDVTLELDVRVLRRDEPGSSS